jgi:hypothetical protein
MTDLDRTAHEVKMFVVSIKVAIEGHILIFQSVVRSVLYYPCVNPKRFPRDLTPSVL